AASKILASEGELRIGSRELVPSSFKN
ncbi:hypothetical protein A2U01_0078645, partial [Trifolium medium]|nr:hypothetical protein [Trifolium medium]